MGTLSVQKSAERSAAAGQLELDPRQFEQNYNRRPFTFTHRLHEHPLLQLDALIDLANRLPEDQVRHSRGKRGFDASFDEEMIQRRHRLHLDQVLEDMQNTDAYVMLHHPDSDPAYRELLLSVLDDVRVLSEPLDPGMTEEAAYIFIASPHAVTPYHMDREMNFLCQVSGSKVVRLWDQDDSSILSHSEIDTIFARPDLPKPGYRPEFAEKAMAFSLTPGTGVHQPLIAPHAVVNGDEVSIAIAITFRSTGSNRRAAIHKANYKLRQLGINPGRYGTSPLFDGIKYGSYRGLRGARHLVGSRGA